MKQKRYKLDAAGLGELLRTLRGEGWRIIVPKARGGAMIAEELADDETPARGFHDFQEPGKYCLQESGDGSFFSYTVPMQSWRRFVNPPEETLFRTQMTGDGFRVEEPGRDGNLRRQAFFGIRVCDLRGLQVLDRIFLENRFENPYYRARREKIFVIAADCFSPAATCFCTSLGLDPVHRSGYDIALAETGPGEFLARASQKSEKYLKNCEVAGEKEIEKEQELGEESRRLISRRFDLEGAKAALQSDPDHPAWDAVAARCLACGNCTLVCPTCFCSSLDETPALDSKSSEHIRRWDSCFNVSHSYIHGGHIRASVKSRYRQWLMHKLVNTELQSGASGCTGCGRCISWCPAAIDFTQDIFNFPGKESLHVSA